MNKFHVVLLSVLVPVALNAADGDDRASSSAPNMSSSVRIEGLISKNMSSSVRTEGLISKKTKNKLFVLAKDVATYNYAPDLVGLAKNGVGLVTKKKLTLPAVIVNNIPNAVNSENANRILATGLVYGLSEFCWFSYEYDHKKYESICGGGLLCKPDIVKKGPKSAVNNMKDASVAIAAIEVLSWAGNKLGGERAEQFAANYSSLIEYAKALGFAVAKQASQAYTPEVFSTK